MTDRERLGSKLPARATALAAALAASVGFAAIYVTLGHSDNAARTPAPPILQAQATAPAPAAREDASGSGRSELAAFVFRKEPEVLPEIKFQDGDGRERSLAEWRGKVVLLNLWATWCLPCRKEMPALDRLQATLGSDQFQVVAISVDRTGLAGAKKFLEETKTPSLCGLCRFDGAPCLLAQGRRPSRHLADRQGGPRDRPAAGSRRMGRRGRSAPDPVRPSLGAKRAARVKDRIRAARCPRPPATGRRRWHGPAVRPCSDDRGH